MRSWGSRPDCVATDEPLYAHYLSRLPAAARSAHPDADRVMQSQPTDWRTVTRTLTGPTPDGSRVWYQKHMAHHLTPEMDRDWILSLRNVLLVREPEEMITSFIKVIPNPTPFDLGLPQQVDLYDFIEARTGAKPLVVDAREILTNPREALTRICKHVGVSFDESMLSWKPGPRDTDGVWAPYWYTRVYESTGFEQYRPKNERVPAHLNHVLRECRGLYERLIGAGGS